MLERQVFWCDPEKLDVDAYTEDVPVEALDGRVPNVVSSLLADGQHAPVIDVDLPCAVVPSSTPGHFHLYIDKAMSWEDYQMLMDTLCHVGIVQQGFRDRMHERGKSIVRMPWVSKRAKPAEQMEPAMFPHAEGLGEEPF